MVDSTSIAIAIVSLVTSTLVAGLSSWLAYTTEKRKAIREEDQLLRKYRDPIALAAHDLQARLYNIFEKDGLFLAEGGQEAQDSLYIYTLFLTGQYLAWRHILRQRAQFIAFTARNRSAKLIRLLDLITAAWNTDNPDDGPGMLMKSHQVAIGEIMTVRDEKQGELFCMGFSAFTKRWKAEENLCVSLERGDRRSGYHQHSSPARFQPHQDQDMNLLPFAEATANTSELTEDLPLHTWFGPLLRALRDLVAVRHELHAHGARFRKLQHLLRELVLLLDEEAANRSEMRRVEKGNGCKCSECSAQGTRPEENTGASARKSAWV